MLAGHGDRHGEVGAGAVTVGAMGSGFTSPPSASSRPLMTTGVRKPGRAAEARRAASRALPGTVPAGHEVGRDRGEGKGQVLDPGVAEDVAHPGEDPLARMAPGARGDRS